MCRVMPHAKPLCMHPPSARRDMTASTDAVRCYALRYPDLLSGFCSGSLQSCDWESLTDHMRSIGSKEGRVVACESHGHRIAPGLRSRRTESTIIQLVSVRCNKTYIR